VAEVIDVNGTYMVTGGFLLDMLARQNAAERAAEIDAALRRNDRLTQIEALVEKVNAYEKAMEIIRWELAVERKHYGDAFNGRRQIEPFRHDEMTLIEHPVYRELHRAKRALRMQIAGID